MNLNAPIFVPGVGLVYETDSSQASPLSPVATNDLTSKNAESNEIQAEDVFVAQSIASQDICTDSISVDNNDVDQYSIAPQVASSHDDDDHSNVSLAEPNIAMVTAQSSADTSSSIPKDHTETVNAIPVTTDTIDSKRTEVEQNNQIEDMREHVNIIFLGHVDSGKSTTSGQVLLLTGMVNERLIEKYTREAIEKKHTSWYLAYIMDALEEERVKGKTVEVGRAHFHTIHRRYTILDAPGHKSYVPNMLSGLCQADISILVISARKGEFEAGFDRLGQTREHILLARALGVRLLIICINKMDDPTVNWDKQRFDNIVERLTPFLASTRFNVNRDVTILPISGLKGINIKETVSKEVCPWYDGKSLIETLDTLPPSNRFPNAPLRAPVLDRHKDMGLVVMAKVEQGLLRRNHSYLVVPSNVMLEVTEIENDEGELKVARPGENIQITVKNIEDTMISRGSIICDLKYPVHAITDFIAQVAIADLPMDKSLITAGSIAVIHIHTAVSDIMFVKILAELDKKTGAVIKKMPKFAKNKSIINVHFQLPMMTPMETFKDSQQLGRFTLRDEDKTIGFGQVLQLGPPRIKNSQPNAPISRSSGGIKRETKSK